MSQRYKGNIKRPKPQDTLLGILRTYAFCRKIQQRTSSSGKSAGGVMYYLSLRIHPKTWVLGSMQLDHTSHVVNVGIKAKCLHFIL